MTQCRWRETQEIDAGQPNMGRGIIEPEAARIRNANNGSPTALSLLFREDMNKSQRRANICNRREQLKKSSRDQLLGLSRVERSRMSAQSIGINQPVSTTTYRRKTTTVTIPHD